MIILCAVESKQVDKALPLCVRVFPSVSPSLVMCFFFVCFFKLDNNTDGKQCVEALTQDFTNQWVTMFIF